MVSIIIPIYNTAQYLYSCIDSIRNQTYKDLQIIMIDDGSDRVTADICDDIASSDSRIEVIHKKNEGVSIARNVGLSVAKGDVICFVDSDDTIKLNMIERLMQVMQQTDAQIVMCDATTITPGRPEEEDTIPLLPHSCILEKSSIVPPMLAQLAGSACRCAYKRTELFGSVARFPVGIKFSEDRIFNIIAMGLADKIAYIKEPYYNRLIREGSACFRFYPDMTTQLSKMHEVIIESVRVYWGNDYILEYEKQVGAQIRNAITNFTMPTNGYSFDKKVRAIEDLCSNQTIRQCIIYGSNSDIRSRMIINKNYILLTIIGILTNKYHQICKKGQYQQ